MDIKVYLTTLERMPRKDYEIIGIVFGDSSKTSNKYNDPSIAALKDMENNAASINADAVIGIKPDFPFFAGVKSYIGTAIKFIKKENK